MPEKRTPSRVKSTTESNKLAGYLAYIFEKGDQEHDLDCIGHASIGQASKAVASAKGILAPKGIKIAIDPSFFLTKTESRSDASEQDNDRTGLRLKVFKL